MSRFDRPDPGTDPTYCHGLGHPTRRHYEQHVSVRCLCGAKTELLQSQIIRGVQAECDTCRHDRWRREDAIVKTDRQAMELHDELEARR